MAYYVDRFLTLPLILLLACSAPALADGGRVIVPIGLIVFVIILVIRLIAR